MSDRLTIRGWLYFRSYRLLMRGLHRFNLHYARPMPLTNDAGWPLHWCHWCGMRDFVMPRGWEPGPLMKQSLGAVAQPSAAERVATQDSSPVPHTMVERRLQENKE